MTFQRIRRRLRRGITATQSAVILGFIALVIIGSLATLGETVDDDLGDSAGNIADPSTLPGRFQ